jgi:hypothetical protein
MKQKHRLRSERFFPFDNKPNHLVTYNRATSFRVEERIPERHTIARFRRQSYIFHSFWDRPCGGKIPHASENIKETHRTKDPIVDMVTLGFL